MPIFWEEFGKWRYSSIHSWPRNQTETVGRIHRWLSWSLNLPVRREDNNLYPSQESNSISSCPICSLVSVQKCRKMEERITNSMSVQNMRTHCEQRIVSYIVNWNCFFALFLVIIVSVPLVHCFCLVSNPVRDSEQSLLQRHRVTFLEQAASFNTH
jgi:hypothetical protein